MCSVSIYRHCTQLHLSTPFPLLNPTEYYLTFKDMLKCVYWWTMDSPEDRKIWENIKHGRDLMNAANPTFSFSLLSTWVLRLRDLFRVRELISDRAWALIIFFPFPSLHSPWYLRPRASLPCSGQFAFLSYHSVIQWYMFSICNGLNALQALRNTGAIEEGTVAALREFTLMGKKTTE